MNEQIPILRRTGTSLNSQIFLLDDKSQIYKLLFNTRYLWVDNQINKKMKEINYFRSLLDSSMKLDIFETTTQCQKYMIQNDKLRFVIITSQKLFEDIKSQLPKKKINYYGLFCQNRKNGFQLMQKYSEIIKFAQDNIKIFQKESSIQAQVIKSYNFLPNFIKITGQQKSIINNNRLNLFGLLNMKNQDKAKQDFISLAQYCFKIENQLIKLYKQTNDINIPLQQLVPLIFDWYSKQSFYYKLVNNVLRVARDPKSFAYIRLPVQQLFNSIKFLYDETPKRKMTVYRGGTISQQEIESFHVGCYIQILNFFSTSKNKQVALNFMQNILFIIKIEDLQKYKKNCDFGFTSIEKFSKQNKNEEEVLFNILNIFKVLKIQIIQSVKKKDKIYHVTLKYGQITRINHQISKNQQQAQNLTRQEKQFYLNYNYLMQLKNIITDQGDVFNKMNLYTEAIQFYNQQLKVSGKGIKVTQSIELKLKLGCNYQSNKNFHKANQTYNQILKICKFFNNQNYYVVIVLFFQGAIKIQENNYDKAIELLNLSLNLFNKLQLNDVQLLIKILFNLGVCLQGKNQKQKSEQYYLQALQWLKINHNKIKHNYKLIVLIYNNLASLAVEQNPERSANLFQQALNICLLSFGKMHQETARIYHGLAKLNVKQQQYKDAQINYNQCLNIYKTLFGQNKSIVIDISLELSNIYFKQQKYKQYTQHGIKLLNSLEKQYEQKYTNNPQVKKLEQMVTYFTVRQMENKLRRKHIR